MLFLILKFLKSNNKALQECSGNEAKQNHDVLDFEVPFLPINCGASYRKKCFHGTQKMFQENRNNCPQRRNISIFSPRNLSK
jgi:hypothetical protein